MKIANKAIWTSALLMLLAGCPGTDGSQPPTAEATPTAAPATAAADAAVNQPLSQSGDRFGRGNWIISGKEYPFSVSVQGNTMTYEDSGPYGHSYTKPYSADGSTTTMEIPEYQYGQYVYDNVKITATWNENGICEEVVFTGRRAFDAPEVTRAKCS